MSEKMPERLKKPSEYKADGANEAELEKMRTISDAELLKGGARYVIVHEAGKRGRRLEVTAEQVAQVKHDRERFIVESNKLMEQRLETQAVLNEFLKEIGVESLEGIPMYSILQNLPPAEVDHLKLEGEYHSKHICCVFEVASSEDRSKILDVLYDKYPAIKSQPVFILSVDSQNFIIRGKKVDRIPYGCGRVL